MHLFKDFVKKYGIGLILGSVTLDGYRKHVLNNKQNKILDKISWLSFVNIKNYLQESAYLSKPQNPTRDFNLKIVKYWKYLY